MADIDKFVYYSNGSKKVLKPTDRIVVKSGGLAFEGDTDNDFETQLSVTDPTTDRTITFPDEDGDVALLTSDALPKALSFPVKNPSTTTTLTKGQIVYISGHSGNKPEVSLARSNSSSTMPAFGFVQSDIAAEAEGYVVYSGLFKGIDTDTSFNEGDTLYVSSTTAGSFDNAPPTGSNLIQNIGKIVKSHSSNGEILVGGAGRTNATPNLDSGKFFIGNASNQSVQSSYTLPLSDGTANQVLQTDGNGTLSFATPSSGGISNIVEDTTPQLGGTLDLNSQTIQGNLLPSTVNTYSLGSAAAEWSDLYLGDASRVYFGNDQDVFLEHVADAGLTLDMGVTETNFEPVFKIVSQGTSSTIGPTVDLFYDKTAPSSSNRLGQIRFSGRDDGGNLNYYAYIGCKPSNDANGSETGEIFLSPWPAAGTSNLYGLSIEGISGESSKAFVNVDVHNGADSGLKLGGTLVKSTAAELNVLDISTESPSDGDVLTYNTVGGLNWSAPSGGGISNLVEDTTPQLGGTLDLNSQTIQGNFTPSAIDTYSLGTFNAEWSNLHLGDGSNIYFGNDQEVQLQHVADSGLTLKMDAVGQSSYDPLFTIQSSTSNTSGVGPQLKIQKMYTDAGDIVGDIYFQGYLSGAYDNYSRIRTRAPAQTHGNLQLSVLSGNVETVAVDIIGDASTTTPKVKISGNYFLPDSGVSEGHIIKGSSTSGETEFAKLKDTIMAELSIPGLDLQTDTNAFRFNCPVDIDIVGLDLYLDQHSTSGNVTVTLTNTTTSTTIQTLSITGTSLSATSTPSATASTGNVITFAITATPANAQGLRAVLHIERKV